MISNRCHYGLRAMLELAKHEGEGPVTTGAIAKAQEIPSRFLEAILRQLKQAGMVDSVRGKDGGYFLAHPANTLSVGEVVRLLEGPLVAVNPHPSGADDTSAPDVLSTVWRKAEAALAEVYDGVSFGELAERDRLSKQGSALNYTI